MSATFETAPPPLDADDVTDLLVEPSVERVGDRWYAASPQALAADPHDLPEHVVADLRAWIRSNDLNVRTCRPFCVGADRAGSSWWSFDYDFRRNGAPAWWIEAGATWSAAHRSDARGRRVR